LSNHALSCSGNTPITAYRLHLIVSTKTPRIGVYINCTLNITSSGTTTSYPVTNCFNVALVGNANDLTVDFTGQTLACGSTATITEAFTSWGTGNTSFCPGTCPETKAKCRFVPGEVIIVQTFPCTPATVATISNQTICTGGTSFSATFSAANANAPISSVEWQIDNAGTWVKLSTGGVYTVDDNNTSPATLTISNVSGLNGTVYRLYVASDAPSSSQTCSMSRTATLTVDPASVGGAVASNQTICTGASPSNNLTLSGHTGNVVRWERSLNAAFSPNTTIVNTTTTLTSAAIGNLTADTWFRAVVRSGVCSEATANSVKITVDANPTTATVGNGQDRCGSLVSLGLGGNTPGVGTGTWTKKSGPGTASFSANANTPNATATVTQAGTYVFTWTIANGVCNSSSADITVNYYAALSAPSVCVVQPSLCGPATGKVKFTDLGPGYEYSINGTNWQTCPVFLNVAAGAATSLKVKNSAGCESAPANCNTICEDPDGIVACEVQGRVNQTSFTQPEAEAGFGVKAYPNPFSDRIKFLVTSSAAGNGSLEIYNMMGQKVKTVYTGFIAAGTQTYELSLPTQRVANLVYVLRVGDKKVTGKILQINK
jgi:hypothetical protein